VNKNTGHRFFFFSLKKSNPHHKDYKKLFQAKPKEISCSFMSFETAITAAAFQT